MSGWVEYVAAWAAFLLSHVIPLRSPVKPWLVAKLGRAGFGLIYSALSVAILIWLIMAAGRAPYVEIWPRAEWQNHVTLAAMALACLILSLAAFRPNPFSFGGWRNERFDKASPGVVGLVRHPILAALGLWAAGHLAPNGDLAHVLMFGGFACFAVLGMRLIDRRRKNAMGREHWARRLPSRTFSGLMAPVRLLAGAAILWALIALHEPVIGLPAIW